MDYSKEIAAALVNSTVVDIAVAEVHKSTTQRGNRYRVYGFDVKGELTYTGLVGINGQKIEDEYHNELAKLEA